MDRQLRVHRCAAGWALGPWSTRALGSQDGWTAIPLIVAEIAASYDRIEDMQQAVPDAVFPSIPLTEAAAFLAVPTRRRNAGTDPAGFPDRRPRRVSGLILVTRDPRRYRHHFPKLALIAPGTHFPELAPRQRTPASGAIIFAVQEAHR